METLSLKAWRERAAAGDAPRDRQIAKAYTADKIAKQEDGRFGFTISTGSVDREGDTISPAGWILEPFQRNPVVLWAHSHRTLPLGMGHDVRVESSALKAAIEFTPEGLHPFNDTVRRMVEGEFLRATSVGFLPKEFEVSDDESRETMWGPGIDFLKQELMEFSIVPVPANAEALADAKSAGIDLAPIVDWAEKTLDEWSGDDAATLRVSRRHLERCYWKARDGGRVLVLDFAGDSVDDEVRTHGLEITPAVDVKAVDNLTPALEALRKQVDDLTARVDASATPPATPESLSTPAKAGGDGADEAFLDEIEREFEATLKEPIGAPAPDPIDELLADPNVAREMMAEAFGDAVDTAVRRARGQLD